MPPAGRDEDEGPAMTLDTLALTAFSMMAANASSVTMIGEVPPAADVTAVEVVVSVPAEVAVVVKMLVKDDDEDIFSCWWSLNITDK